MYLYDYQRTTLTKLRRRGCSYIVQGPRRIGMEVMMANYALMSAVDVWGTNVAIICPRNDIAIEFITKKIPIILFDTKQVGFGMFDPSTTISTRVNDRHITLSNGSEIRTVSSAEFSDSMACDLRWLDDIDIVIIDSSNLIANMDQVLASLVQHNFISTVITLTGGMDKTTHQLYVDSIKGKNDFEYIRIPVEVLPKSAFNNILQMKEGFSDEEWNHSIEMVPKIEREIIT
jgi:hypothetical protein